MIARHFREAPCVFLDCDGVLFDSNGFKLEAMLSVLSEHPARAVEEMRRFWSANGGMSRYKKFEYFFREIVATADVAARVRTATARFGKLVRKAYVSVSPFSEALHFARATGRERCFVVSGADQSELGDIFTEKGIVGLFAEVCGSPTAKLEHVTRILREHDCPPARALFIGDGGGDYDVCRRLGVPFVYLDQYSEWREAADVLKGAADTWPVKTWTELLALLELERSASAP